MSLPNLPPMDAAADEILEELGLNVDDHELREWLAGRLQRLVEPYVRKKQYFFQLLCEATGGTVESSDL